MLGEVGSAPLGGEFSVCAVHIRERPGPYGWQAVTRPNRQTPISSSRLPRPTEHRPSVLMVHPVSHGDQRVFHPARREAPVPTTRLAARATQA